MTPEQSPNRSERKRTPAAAKHLGISESKLVKMRVFGGGPEFIKIGRAVVYDVEALDHWLAKQPRHERTAGEMVGRGCGRKRLTSTRDSGERVAA